MRALTDTCINEHTHVVAFQVDILLQIGVTIINILAEFGGPRSFSSKVLICFLILRRNQYLGGMVGNNEG